MSELHEPVQDRVFDGDDQSRSLSEYLDLLRQHWRVLAVFSGLGLLAGVVHFLNAPDIYQASTRIQIERRTTNPLGAQSYWMESWWNPEFYPTQQEILKSRGLATRVVKRLRLWERRPYDQLVDEVSFSPGDEVTAAQDEAVIGSIASAVRGGLVVLPVRGTQLIDIVVRDTDPELAMEIANGYAEAFIDYGIETKRTDAASVQSSIEDQIARVEQSLAVNDRRLQEYSREKDIVKTSGESNLTAKRLEAANQAWLEAQTKKIQAQAAYNEIRNRPRESLADTLSGGLVGDERAQLFAKRRAYESDLVTYQPSYPAMQLQLKEIEQLENGLASLIEETAQHAIDEKRATFEATRLIEQQTRAAYDRAELEVRDLRSAETEYNNLLSTVSNERDLLNELKRSRGQTDVAITSSDRSSIRQIDSALRPSSPISPNLRSDLGIGVAFGMLVGFSLIFLLEVLDRTLKSTEEIERRLGLPTLAAVPDLNARASRYGYGRQYGASRASPSQKRGDQVRSIDLIPHNEPRQPVSEAYRALRTSLLMSSAEGVETVAIASSSASEGKTVTASNLAVVMSQLGKRTLLVDADFRKPRIHQVFDVSNRNGVVNFLIGEEELEHVLVATEIDNLTVMPAGPTPPNPSELLASERMHFLLERARELFDFTIIDTPPALAVTDATLLGGMVDGVVLCVRAGSTPREVVKACRDRLRQAGVKILGVVLNCQRPIAGRYQSSYSYHYGAPSTGAIRDAGDDRADDAA